MATVVFTQNLERHVECPTAAVDGVTVRAVLDAVFARSGYVLDSQDVHCLVQCASTPTTWWAQQHNGIFRSTDDMATWIEIEEAGPDTAWFVPAIKDEKRIPVDGKLVVTRTRDGGKTFDVLESGLPDRFAYDLIYRHALALSPEGVLAFGSTTGNVFASADRGESWSVVSNYLPPVHAVTFAS